MTRSPELQAAIDKALATAPPMNPEKAVRIDRIFTRMASNIQHGSAA